MQPAKVTEIELIQNVPLASFPDGDYEGRWCGYIARALIGNGNYEFRTDEYLRGTQPVIIKVRRGEVTIEAIPNEGPHDDAAPGPSLQMMGVYLK